MHFHIIPYTQSKSIDFTADPFSLYGASPWGRSATQMAPGIRSPGPAFSRLLPIGTRAEGGPALRTLTYASLHFLVKLFV